mgnify:CR=1 FL=1
MKKSYFIIIRGPLGCGKSTVAEKLSKVINAKHIFIDKILDEHNLINNKEEGFISQKSFIKANKIIIPKVKDYLLDGKPVVFDGNFYWKSQIEDLIKRLDFPNYIFTLKSPLKVCIQRNKQRKKVYSEEAVKVVYKKSTEFKYGTTIDITKPLNQCVKKIISYLP